MTQTNHRKGQPAMIGNLILTATLAVTLAFIVSAVILGRRLNRRDQVQAAAIRAARVQDNQERQAARGAVLDTEAFQ
jgi:hypothetical protein